MLIHKNEEPKQVFCILLQTAINADHLTLNNKSREISVHQEISAALRDIMPKLIIAKSEQNTYAIAGIYTNESCDTNAHFLHKLHIFFIDLKRTFMYTENNKKNARGGNPMKLKKLCTALMTGIFLASAVISPINGIRSVKIEPIGITAEAASSMRRPYDPEHPMLIVHIDTWNVADPAKIIATIPEKLRPYCVFNISLFNKLEQRQT